MKKDIAFSKYGDFCEGYAPGQDGKYILCLKFGIGVAKKQFGHQGSATLDQINAFDKAEVEGANLGQINMVTVSSFSGPGGLIWGYDLLSLPKIEIPELNQGGVKVYSGEPLVFATEQLVGTVTKPIFPVLPGSHVLCASKNIKKTGPCLIYAAIGLGIAEDRNNACLMMEDVGEIEKKNYSTEYVLKIKDNLVKSVLEVGKNQRVKYKEVFVIVKVHDIKEDEIGCALVASPYLSLPKKLKRIVSKDSKLNLGTWKQFLEKNK